MLNHQNLTSVVALTTCPSSEIAEKITTEILEERLAACVNAFPKGVSSYWWEGKIERSEEILLLIKTERNKLERISELLARVHPYELPELIALDITAGSQRYLDWIASSVRG